MATFVRPGSSAGHLLHQILWTPTSPSVNVKLKPLLLKRWYPLLIDHLRNLSRLMLLNRPENIKITSRSGTFFKLHDPRNLIEDFSNRYICLNLAMYSCQGPCKGCPNTKKKKKAFCFVFNKIISLTMSYLEYTNIKMEKNLTTT